MKILYLTNAKVPADGAQALQILAMCRAFFIALGKDFAFYSPENEKNISIQSDYVWQKIKIAPFLPRSVRYFLLVVKSLPFVRRFSPDYIYTRDVGVAFVYRLINFRIVYEIHKPFETFIGDLIFRLIVKKIKVVAISGALKKNLLGKYKITESEIVVAHDGAFIEDFKQIKNSKSELKEQYLGIGYDKFVAIYSGSFQKGKGIELILEAAKKMKDVDFALIGGDKSDIEFEAVLPSNVIFLGRKQQKEIPYYLKSADLLILPNTKNLSYYKYTSPLKLFEYMASGVPILASRLGSITEILNENNAFLFNPESIDDFTSKIKHIKNNYKEAKDKANIAFDDVKKYTWQERVKNIINFIGGF